MTDDNSLVPTSGSRELIKASGADRLLASIRPEWQAKNLIERVRRILPVDPSSACQRLLNAAVYDIRDKILIAGMDIAKEAAERFKMPSIAKPEDISDNYTISNVIDLAYRMGLFTRPEWRRIRRAYEIRRDLEHEDDQYEAQAEDILYIFKTAIEIVLSRQPAEMIRLSDVKELIEAPERAAPSEDLLHEFKMAAEPRQREILEHLINTALNSKNADIIRQNAVELLRTFGPSTKRTVQVELAQYVQQRVEGRRLELVVAKVAFAAGVLAYLKQRQVADLFGWLLQRLNDVGFGWRSFPQHESVLNDFEDVGALVTCVPKLRKEFVLWMTLCYLGEPGFSGFYGRRRPVFYSDVAAPRIYRMFREAGQSIEPDLLAVSADARVKRALDNQNIARRYEQLQDAASGQSEE